MHVLRVGGFAMATAFGFAAVGQQTYFPAPVPPAGNPITTPKALLGMALFWEEQMSSSNTIACGTCHVFRNGGVDPRAGNRTHPGPDGAYGTPDDLRGAIGVPSLDASGRHVDTQYFGIEAQVTTRKAPTVINAAYLPSLFYDGRARTGDFLDPITQQVVLTGNTALENVISGPPLNTVEMGHVGRNWTDVANKIANARPLALASNVPSRLATFINGSSSYRPLFEAAYGPGATVTPTRIIMAIATYIRTLVSDTSKYDRYVAGVGTLTAQEQAGLTVFNSVHGQAAACVRCHGDIQASSHTVGPSPMQTTMYGSLPVPNSHNTGIRPIADDRGVGGITNNTSDMGRFRAPGLRNTELHGSWFHTNAITSLDQVVDFYDRGGDFFVNQAVEIEPMNLTVADKAALVAFLRTLTDSRVQNEQQPFDRPRLGSERQLLPAVFGTGMTAPNNRAARTVANLPVFVGSRDAALAVDDAPVNSAAVLMWDVVAEPQGFSYAGVRLYLGLYEFTANYVGQTSSRANGTGYASYAFDVPANPGLAGLHVFTQWLMLDQAGGLTTSSAAEIVVQ